MAKLPAALVPGEAGRPGCRFGRLLTGLPMAFPPWQAGRALALLSLPLPVRTLV